LLIRIGTVGGCDDFDRGTDDSHNDIVIEFVFFD
jgi:hypothetical protein